MREISFVWEGAEVRLTPSFLVIQRIATTLAKVSDGAETTVGLAYKCASGGIEPVYLVIPLIAFLRHAHPERQYTEEAVFGRLMESQAELVGFRIAYMQAMLPHVDMGKDRAAQQPASPAAQTT